MNRFEFMSRLSSLLSDIPENERDEAVQYYNDYLNDAGVENEEEVLESLGTPEELAASIRRGLQEESGQKGEFSEKGYQESEVKAQNQVAFRSEPVKSAQGAEAVGGRAGGAYGGPKEPGGRQGTYADSAKAKGARSVDLDRRYRRGKKGNMSGGMSALMILLCIVAAPVAIPLIFAFALVAVILAAVLIFLLVLFVVVGIICVAAGVVAFCSAFVDLFTFPAGAVMALGMSLVTIGVGVLMTLGFGWLVKMFPRAFRSAVDFCSGLFRKKGGYEG